MISAEMSGWNWEMEERSTFYFAINYADLVQIASCDPKSLAV